MRFALSPAGKTRLKNEEGWRLVPYLCPAGKWTISAGVRLYPDDKVEGLVFNKLLNRWFGKITEETAEKLFASRIAIAEKSLNNLVRVPLNQNQVDALVSFVYNIGEGQFMGSTLRHHLNGGRFSLAALEFKRWVHDKYPELVAALQIPKPKQ